MVDVVAKFTAEERVTAVDVVEGVFCFVVDLVFLEPDRHLHYYEFAVEEDVVVLVKQITGNDDLVEIDRTVVE